MQGRGWRELSRAWLLRVSSAAARLFAFGSWRDISREAWKTSNAPPPTARAAVFGQIAARRSLPALRLWWLFRGERKDKKALLQEERLQKQAVRALCELLAGEEPSAQRLNALALLYNNNIRRCIAAFSSQGLASALLALDKQGGDVDTFYRVLAERVAGTKRVRWKGREALIKATLLRAVADTHCQLLGYEAKDAHQRDRARRSASRILVLLPPRVRAELRRTAQNSWAELLGSAVAVSNLSNSEPSLSKALQCLRSWEGEARKAAENHYRPLERTNKEGEGASKKMKTFPLYRLKASRSIAHKRTAMPFLHLRSARLSCWQILSQQYLLVGISFFSVKESPIFTTCAPKRATSGLSICRYFHTSVFAFVSAKDAARWRRCLVP